MTVRNLALNDAVPVLVKYLSVKMLLPAVRPVNMNDFDSIESPLA